MVTKIEHIGIAVKSIDASKDLYTLLLNTAPYKEECVEAEKVRTLFFKTGESKIELLESTSLDGPIAAFVEKKGEGIHHIAFKVDNIYDAMKTLTEKGFRLTSPEPRPGADNKLVCFIHPKSTNGVLIELCQEMPGLE